MDKDFNKFLRSRSISSSFQNDYFRKVNQSRNSTTLLLDDNGMQVDVFTKLIEDRIIFLADDVNSDTCSIIKAQLLYLESKGDEDISLYIDSGGGEVYSGLGLIDVMDFIKPDIVTINTGLAASMAAVILTCGSDGKRKALKRSRTMIHQPLGGMWGQASDMEIEAKEIMTLKRELYDILVSRTGQTYEKVNSDSDRDYWMTASDAKSYGLIDHIITKR